jgi:hypothetical protein
VKKLKESVFCCIVALAGGCTNAQGENIRPAAEPAPVGQQANALDSNSAVSGRSRSPDAESLSDEERLDRRKERWGRALETLHSEPVDDGWASPTASAIEKTLGARLTPEERAFFQNVECHTTNCAVQVTAPSGQIHSLSLTLRSRVAADLRAQGYATTLSLVTDPDSNGEQTSGYYFFAFVRK